MFLKKIAMLAMIGFMGVSALFTQKAYAAEKPVYLKSVTYFGDEWPINYWGSEDKDMAANFAQIKENGFNSIILVVPWREFQPNNAAQKWNPVAFDRLNRVMACAEEHGLWVVLRIGYSWDYYGKAELPERFYGIVRYNGVDRLDWLRYCEKIYETVSVYPNFHSGFITWEDFWDYVHCMGRDYNKKQRTQMAFSCGYQEYLEKNYTLSEVAQKYGERFDMFSDVYIPYRHKEAAELFFEFYDKMLLGLLEQSQEKFPGLSMEVRADGDPVYLKDGDMYYYSHNITYPCEGADYSALMYSVSMGQRNICDRISAAEALAATDRNLSALMNMSGKKYFAEQLLYMDSTAEFSYNTQIHDEEVGAYVRELAPILENSTMGYGLWVYRNYVNSCVYNGQFGLDTLGWTFIGRCGVDEVDGTKMARLEENGYIYQNLNGRMSKGETIQVEVGVKALAGRTNLKIMLGDQVQELAITESGTYKLEFPWNSNYEITLSSDERIYVDDIRVYTYEQYGRIYGTDGEAQDLVEDFRILNSRLP